MNINIKEAKQTVRQFIKQHYSDENLAAMLAHMQDGHFAYRSCCCLVGGARPSHALRGRNKDYHCELHYLRAKFYLAGAGDAEEATWILGFPKQPRHNHAGSDPLRRRRLIPILKAELRRREHERSNGVPTPAAMRIRDSFDAALQRINKELMLTYERI